MPILFARLWTKEGELYNGLIFVLMALLKKVVRMIRLSLNAYI